MAAFTVINTDDDWTVKAIPEEYRISYSQRSKAIGGNWRTWTGSAWANGAGTAADVIESGDDIQAQAFWGDMQQFCISNCTSFIDTTITIDGDSATDWTDFNYANAAAMYAAAGISGFRRSTNGTTFTTAGVMQVGDVIGPWIMEDLAAVFGVLTKIGKQGSWDWQGGATENDYDTTNGADPVNAYASAYSGLTWPPGSSDKSVSSTAAPMTRSYGLELTDEDDETPDYDDSIATCQSIENNAKFAVESALDGDVTTYIFPDVNAGALVDYWDTHSYGLTQSVWNEVSTADAFTAASFAYSDDIGDLTNKPDIAALRHTETSDPEFKEYGNDGWIAEDVFGVVEYDFDYS